MAVYGAPPCRSPGSGKYAVLAATKGRTASSPAPAATINVSSASADPIPRVGQMAPKVHTDTLASAKGDVTKIDTRDPPSDMHKVDFADDVGKKPVALLFSTPQLCQSRVCGPVTDIALQMEAKYGDKMDFIHQEVYVDNNPSKGLRPPLQQFQLRTEPWLFVVNKSGPDHGPARGVDRREAVRERRQVRPVRRARRGARGGARRPGARPGGAFAHGLAQREQLPIPQWLFAWAAAAVLVISFFALAVLWPEPRLEDEAWRAVPGGRVIAGPFVQAAVRAHRRRPAGGDDPGRLHRRRARRWTTGRRRSS